MKRLFCVALLCAVGCSSAAVVEPTPLNGDHEGVGIQKWIPGAFDDLWEVMDARIGLDYGFGGHVKLTDLARIGIFDHSDFSLVGIERDIFYGEWNFPDLQAWNNNGSWDLGVKFGVGLGMEGTLHTWELIDFFSSVIGFGYWSLDDD
ncbi:MAG: hypothetical protein ACYTG2_03740 [Planctomycetota bacterium]|jgi:hypothetical protein